MFFEAPLQNQMPIIADKTVWAEGAESPAPPLEQPPPSAEQIQAAEALFGAREQESQQVAGILGLWTSAMILKDLTTETFTEPVEEFEPRLKKKNEENDEE
jgi:hypothetical protein